MLDKTADLAVFVDINGSHRKGLLVDYRLVQGITPQIVSATNAAGSTYSNVTYRY